MAAQYDTLTKSAEDLLKLSFPFDAKKGTPRSQSSIKLSTKSENGTGVSVTFEKEEAAASKSELTFKVRDVDVKSSFSTGKETTIGTTLTFADKLVAGSKVAIDLKAKDLKPIFGATVDYSAEKFSFREKGEYTLGGKWSSETGVVGRITDATQIGARAKLSTPEAKDKQEGIIREVALTAVHNTAKASLSFGGAVTEAHNYALKFAAFVKFAEESDGRFATSISYPILGKDASPEVKAALLFNINKDTTVGFYGDQSFNVAGSLKVKVNPNFSFNASVFAPFPVFVETPNRVVGLGFEFST